VWIEEVVPQEHGRADEQAGPAPEELRAREHDQAGADGPDDAERDEHPPPDLCDARRCKAPRRGNDEPLHQNQPRATREQKAGERPRALARGHQPRARAGEEHEHRGAEVRDPPGEEDGGAYLGIGRRILLGAEHHVIAHVIESHDDDHEAAEHVDAGEPVRAGIGGRSVWPLDREGGWEGRHRRLAV
jgi:hypothetical protein